MPSSGGLSGWTDFNWSGRKSKIDARENLIDDRDLHSRAREIESAITVLSAIAVLSVIRLEVISTSKVYPGRLQIVEVSESIDARV
jgi:hypothetical protein